MSDRIKHIKDMLLEKPRKSDNPMLNKELTQLQKVYNLGVTQALEAAEAEVDKARIVNRLEIIDHTDTGNGRDYVKWVDDTFDVTQDLQDDGRTLKVFLNEALSKSNNTGDRENG